MEFSSVFAENGFLIWVSFKELLYIYIRVWDEENVFWSLLDVRPFIQKQDFSVEFSDE